MIGNMKMMRAMLLGAALSVGGLVPISATALDTTARAAMVIDHDTGTVLLSKNPDMPLPPASMSKLMTLYMVFEALQQGRLSLEEEFRVSTKAWQMGGSKMFLREGETVSVVDLIRGLIVQSGNDACVVLAEGLAGSEEAFAIRMTQRARELGMMDSTFANSTGWPHPDHRMSARDLTRLATLLIRDFPEYYPYFAETTFSWDGITQENRNPLLNLGIGADGLKTGHTEEAGYGLVGSAKTGDRRVTLMITGLESAQGRLVEAERLMTWAFREFQAKSLFEGGETITEAAVWLGMEDRVALVAPEDIVAILPYAGRGALEAKVIYDGPIEAPIEDGQIVAELVLNVPEIGETRYPLQAANAVPRGGFMARVDASARILLTRLLASGQDLMADTE